MAWKKVLPMEERVRFVLEVEKGELPIAELCRRFGVSRKTGYKWIRRYEAKGLEGVRERSRQPLRCPHRTGQEWEERIIYERLKHPRWGPKKIREILNRKGWAGKVPASSTIGGILSRADLVKPRKRRRHRRPSFKGPLREARYPNHIWAVDYKGWFRTRDGERCEPLTVSDVYSRYVLEVKGLVDQSYERAWKVFDDLFGTYGLPEVIRSDNGGPFASTGAGGLSRLSVWWVLLGINLELIAPGHPEQNGVHERMHLTLKEETCKPPAGNRRAQQRRFNRWRREFNEERPHEALDMQTPSQRYRRSSRHYDGKLKQPTYPEGYEIRRVRSNGEIKWKGRKRFIGEALKGTLVGVKSVEEDWNQVYFGSILLGDLHESDTGGLRSSISLPLDQSQGKVKV